MRLVFFDESKDDQDYPHYHLCGVSVDETVLHEVESEVNELANEVFGSFELSAETEFHAAEIFHRKKNFKNWDDFGKRLEVIGRLLSILSRDEVDLIDIQVNCSVLYQNQNAADIAFMFLCERANGLLRAKKSMGMLIGDRESDQHAARYATSLSSYRASGTDFQFGVKITNLVDSVHFTQSHLSRFLQLADVYAWIQQFRHRNRESTNARHQALFEILKRPDIKLFPSKYKEWPKFT